MADQILETVESNSSSIASFMSKLPGRRIDTWMREVAMTGMPERSEMEGGYNPLYVQVAHLPIFSLYSDKAEAFLKRKWNDYVPESRKAEPPKLNLGAQVLLTGVDLVSSGPGIVSTIKWTGRAIGAEETAVATLMHKQNILARFTRWTIPAAAAADLRQGNTLWFVDMLELYWDPDSTRGKMAKTGGNIIAVRSGLPGDGKLTLKMLDFEPKTVKAGGHWSTKYKVKELCEALLLVHGTAEVQMDVVARVQRRCTVQEHRELIKQFEKHWHVPMLRS
jgi:hypothetical protein